MIIYVIHTIHRPYVHSTDFNGILHFYVSSLDVDFESPHHRVATFFDAIPPLIRRATYAAGPVPGCPAGASPLKNVVLQHVFSWDYNMELHSNILGCLI